MMVSSGSVAHFHEEGGNGRWRGNQLPSVMVRDLNWLLPWWFLCGCQSGCLGLRDLFCNLNTFSVLRTEITNFVFSHFASKVAEAPGGDETPLKPGEYATALLEIPHLEDECAELIPMASS